MDFMDLVELVISGEQREETQNFKEHAAHPPDVHFVVVVAVGEQALGRPVPARRNVLLRCELATLTVKGCLE